MTMWMVNKKEFLDLKERSKKIDELISKNKELKAQIKNLEKKLYNAERREGPRTNY